MVDDGPESWSIRKAVNWIRNRSASRLDSGDDAEQAFERHGRRMLQHQLASGNLVAYSKGKPISQGFWRGAAFFGRGDGARTLYESWPDLTVSADACRQLWPPVPELIGAGVSLRAFLEKFGFDALSKNVSIEAKWLLSSEVIRITGLNSAGERVTVDPYVLGDAVVDGVDGVIATRDGGVRWASVMVAPETALANPLHGSTTEAAVAKLATVAELVAWAKPIFGRIIADGHEISRESYSTMMKAHFGIRLSEGRLDETWLSVAPEQWRRPNRGRPKKGVMIRDWQKYLPATEKKPPR